VRLRRRPKAFNRRERKGAEKKRLTTKVTKSTKFRSQNYSDLRVLRVSVVRFPDRFHHKGTEFTEDCGIGHLITESTKITNIYPARFATMRNLRLNRASLRELRVLRG
jgi:hypothetical protein